MFELVLSVCLWGLNYPHEICEFFHWDFISGLQLLGSLICTEQIVLSLSEVRAPLCADKQTCFHGTVCTSTLDSWRSLRLIYYLLYYLFKSIVNNLFHLIHFSCWKQIFSVGFVWYPGCLSLLLLLVIILLPWLSMSVWLNMDVENILISFNINIVIPASLSLCFFFFFFTIFTDKAFKCVVSIVFTGSFTTL